MVVGVNRFTAGVHQPVPMLEIDPRLEADQVDRLQVDAEQRDQRAVGDAAGGGGRRRRGRLQPAPPMKEALRLGATLGEVSDVLRDVFGTYRPS